MTHEKLYMLLKTLNIPIAYDHFNDDKKMIPPFLAYREQIPSNFKADNLTFISFFNFELELVTEKKDIELERKIEKLLTNNNISYDKSDEIWDREEKIYHIFYEI